MDDSSFSYVSAVEMGVAAGAPRAVGFLPADFFSASVTDFTSLGTELISKGSSEGSCIVNNQILNK